MLGSFSIVDQVQSLRVKGVYAALFHLEAKKARR